MKCDLTNEELINEATKWIKRLCETGGSAWSLRVPVDFNHDPDILFSELCSRLQSPQSLLVEEAAKEYLKKVGSHDKPDVTEHDFKEGWKACLLSQSTQPITDKPITELTDDDALAVFDILGNGGRAISNEAKIFEAKDLLATNRLYNAQTNIPGVYWYRVFNYLKSKGYKIE